MASLNLKTAGRMAVLFVNYHGTLGGGQVHLLTLLDGLDRARFHPHVVSCQEGPFTEALRERGLQPVIIPFGKGKLRHWTVSLPAIWRMYRLLKNRRIQVVHVSGLQEAKLTAWAAARAGVPMAWVVAP